MSSRSPKRCSPLIPIWASFSPLTSDATRGAYSALTEMHLAGKVKLIGCDQDLLAPSPLERWTRSSRKTRMRWDTALRIFWRGHAEVSRFRR